MLGIFGVLLASVEPLGKLGEHVIKHCVQRIINDPATDSLCKIHNEFFGLDENVVFFGYFRIAIIIALIFFILFSVRRDGIRRFSMKAAISAVVLFSVSYSILRFQLTSGSPAVLISWVYQISFPIFIASAVVWTFVKIFRIDEDPL